MKVKKGDFVEVEAKGIVVRGIVESADGNGSKGNEFNLEIRNEKTAKIHYWKQVFDGGTVKVLSELKHE